MNDRRRWRWVWGIGVLLAFNGRAEAGLVEIGSQHFTDGQILTDALYATGVNGQPAPFNGFIGTDAFTNFAASYTFNFAGQIVTSANFSLGIFDADSAAAGDQVGLFTINGFDLTSLLNTAFNGHGGTQQEYDIYTIALPSTVLASIASGTAMINLQLAGPGLGGDPGSSATTTGFNGAGLDFSSLDLNPTSASVPEPSSLTLMGIAVSLGGLAARRCRGW